MISKLNMLTPATYVPTMDAMFNDGALILANGLGTYAGTDNTRLRVDPRNIMRTW